MADEEGVDVAEGRVEKRTAMDFGNDGGHVAVGDVHDDGVVEKAEAPSPLMSRACGEVDEEGSDQEEGEIEDREQAGEAGGADKAEPSDEDEELEDVFVGEEGEEVASGKRRSRSLALLAKTLN